MTILSWFVIVKNLKKSFFRDFVSLFSVTVNILANDTDVGIEDLMLNTLDPSNHEESLSAYVDRMTKAYVAKVLQECQGVKVDACKKLSVERTTLYRLIKKYQLDSI